MSNLEKFKRDLRNMYQNARQRDIDEFAPHLLYIFEKYKINTRLRQAHFLAQVGHESGELYHKEETTSGAAYEGRRDLGNTQRGDGRKYKGAGIIQITGRANFTEFDRFMNAKGEIIKNPRLIVNDSKLSTEAAGWFWHTRNINPLADRNDIIAVTKRINGGTNGLAHRRQLFARALNVIKEPYSLDKEPVVNTGGALSQPTKEEPTSELSVKEIQSFLNQHIKSRLLVDGVLGPKTKAEIKKLQQNYGLSATGNLNAATKALIVRLM